MSHLSENVTVMVRRGKLQGAVDALDAWLTRDDAELEAASQAAREAAFLHDAMRQLYDAAAAQLDDVAVEDLDGNGHFLQEAFERCLSAMRRVLTRAEAVGAEAAELRQALAEAERFVEWFLDTWPFDPTPEEVAQDEADYAAGRYLGLDDAFAEIAGVPKEEWLARVEQRRRELETERGSL